MGCFIHLLSTIVPSCTAAKQCVFWAAPTLVDGVGLSATCKSCNVQGKNSLLITRSLHTGASWESPSRTSLGVRDSDGDTFRFPGPWSGGDVGRG